MRAATLVDYRRPLEVRVDLPEPECPPDGVVLEVLACGVCRSDWHGWIGENPKVAPGRIGGHEYCGRVVEAGRDAVHRVDDVLVAPFILACGRCPECRSGHQPTCADQRLPGFTEHGAFAERIAVPRDHNLAILPDGLSRTLAAAMGCRVTTAWHALTGPAALRGGEWLAVHGTGGVGLSAALLGRALGARVVVVDVVREKLDHALSLGLDAAVLADERTAEAIRDVTGGGAHVSVEALGIPATVNASLRCLRPRGRHVQIGMPTGRTAWMEVDLRAVYQGNLAVYGTRGMPSWRYPSLFAMVAEGGVDLSPLIARTVALSDVSAELAAFDGPMPPGVAVVTDFAG